MNKLFTPRALVICIAMLFCQLAVKAQTAPAAKPDTSFAIKADTALSIKAGSTLVIKADTTLVINADTAALRKVQAALARRADAMRGDSAKITPPANTTASAVVKSTDTAASAAKPVETTAAVVNKPAETSSAIVKPADTTSTKGLAVNTGKTTIIAPPVDGQIEVRGANGTTQLMDMSAVNKAKTDGLGQKTDGGTIKSDSSAQKTDSGVAKTDSSAQKTDTEIAKADSSAQKTDGAVAKNQTTDATTPAKDATTTPAVTGNTDASAAKTTEPIPTPNTDNNVTKKSDSTLLVKADTTLKKDTTLAKKDTTLKTRSDTTIVQKDTTAAQTEVKAQNGFLEVGGPGLAISANYDARFKKERNGWGYRVGLGFFSSGGNSVETVPFQINYLIGEHSHMLELGAGTTFLNSKGTNVGNSKWEFDKVTGFIGTASIGYRFQPAHKGINIRIAFVPILDDDGLIPAGGVSVGYTFK